MNADEQKASVFLRSLGLGEPEYEPQGPATFPDFALGPVAVEVRRLNQHHLDEGGAAEGLEQSSISIWQGVQRLTETYASDGQPSWFLFIDIDRPVAKWSQLREPLRKSLDCFHKSSEREPRRLFREAGLTVDVARASVPLESFYRMGALNDLQAGGFVLGEMLTNAQLCSDQKAKKRDVAGTEYKRYWLVLVDYIANGVSDEERKLFGNDLAIEHDWERVILIDPRDPPRSFELKAGRRVPPKPS